MLNCQNIKFDHQDQPATVASKPAEQFNPTQPLGDADQGSRQIKAYGKILATTVNTAKIRLQENQGYIKQLRSLTFY